MARIVFGEVTPCRFCKGAGERVLKMTPQEHRERTAELRRMKRRHQEPDRVPLLKPCPDCDGKGYIGL